MNETISIHKSNKCDGGRPARRRTTVRAAMFIVGVGLMLSLSAAVAALDYADRTPGHTFLTEALDAYDARHYTSAMEKFRRAAHWADKVAQYNLGVMHLHGQGTEPDSARAWAWFELAAERNYPHMVEVAEALWDVLDESQRERARNIHEDELLERFGDAAAVPRTARHMRSQQRGATGSRVGFRSGMLRVIEVEDVYLTPAMSTKVSASGRVFSGSEYYDPAKFDFYNVLAAESTLFEAEQRGEVRLGDFELINDETDTDARRGGQGDRR